MAWPERLVSAAHSRRFSELIQRRARGEPVAYLLGRREFWSLQLTVSPATLIPRPDTECLVDAAVSLLPPDATGPVLDLGTGSGAIALALATERPGLPIVAVERCNEALAVARANGARADVSVEFLQSDWFSELAGRQFAMIVSNPPYVASDDPHLHTGDLRFEPLAALDGGPDGLAALRAIIAAAPQYLLPGGMLLLEHGFDQGAAVINLLEQRGFQDCLDHTDLGGQPRVARARWPESTSPTEITKHKEDP
jgi:release factor glutamine methyltransferase